MSSCTLLLFVLVAIGVVYQASANSSKIYVATGGNDANSGTENSPVGSLSAAIAKGQTKWDTGSIDRVEFIVSGGIYQGPKNSGLQIVYPTFIIANLAENVVISCNRTNDPEVVAFYSSVEFSVEALTITDCKEGVRFSGAEAPFQSQNCDFIDCYGYGIYVNGASTINIELSNFTHSEVYLNKVSSGIEIQESYFVGRSGVLIRESTWGSIKDTFFWDIRAIMGNAARALSIYGGHWNMVNVHSANCFYRLPSDAEVNEDANGGAFFLTSGANVTTAQFYIASCAFSNCSSSSGGGAIYLQGVDASIVSSSISQCLSNYGGGIFLNQTTASSSNTLFSECVANQEGGGMYIASNSSIEMESLTFISNAARIGSSIGCCEIGDFCHPQVFVYDNSLSVSGSTSVIPQNITCPLMAISSFEEVVTETEFPEIDTITREETWWVGFVISIGVLVGLACLTFVFVAIIAYIKRRREYYQLLLGDG